MRMFLVFVLLAGVFSSRRSPAATEWTIHVDCAAPAGGDGTAGSPYGSITAALPDASALSGVYDVTIEAAAGTCEGETFPIVLDFPGTLRGAPSGTTLITRQPSDPLPAYFIRATGPGVRIRDLALDSAVPLQEDNDPGRPTPMPDGIFAEGAEDYVIDRVRIERMTYSVRSHFSSGRVTRSTLGPTGSGIFAAGGPSTPAPRVVLLGNRITYRVNGIAAVGGVVTGDALDLLVVGNRVETEYTYTGPTNPAAVRLSPVGLQATDGTLVGLFALNRFDGAAQYGFMIHGGPRLLRSEAVTYTGALDVAFAGNALDPATQTPSLVSFTNARATVLPCELNPDCSQRPVWEYIEGTTYWLWHFGELDGVLLDFPELDPLDGHPLDDELYIDGEPIDHETFVEVPL